MKTNFHLIILILLLSTYIGKAQLISSYGIKAGITSAGQSWNYKGSFSDLNIFDKSRIGLDVAGYAEWFNLPVLSVLTEMHYIQKGSRYEFIVRTFMNPEGNGETRAMTPRIDYLSIPILAKLRYNAKLLTLYGIVGPHFDFLIGKNSDAQGAVFDDLKKTDFGFIFGFGFQIPIKYFANIGGEFRYSPGGQNVFSNQILDVKNNSLEFLLVVGL